jgi:PAS domain S-box-containing protein
MGINVTKEALPSPDQLLSEIAFLKKRFNILINYTGSVEIWVNADRKVVFVSPGIERISGYTAEEFMTDPGLFAKIIPPENLEAFHSNYWETREIGTCRWVDRRIVRKDGETRWVHTRITPLFDEQGNYDGFRSSTVDITERKIAEQILEQAYESIQEKEETYRIVADYTNDMERWVLPDKKLAYISPSCKKITGYSREEFMNNPGLFLEIMHPDDQKWFSAKWEEAFSGGDLPENERLRIIRKDGQVRWIDISFSKVVDKNGSFNGYRSSSRDITLQKELETELETKTRMFSSIAEDQVDLIIRTDRQGVITYINKSFAEFFNLDRDVVVGRKYFEVAASSDIEKAKKSAFLPTRETPVAKAIFEYPRPFGKIHYIEWIFRNFYNEAGELTERLVIGRDVTELKEATQNLEKALAEVDELKTRLEQENLYLREKFNLSGIPDGIVTNSPLMADVLKKIKQVARTDAPVLLSGETGTGKELVAQAIHRASNRRNRMMITVNCAALPESLIESELFGREKGAYTGALASQIGRFEIANKSTIFLDEIGELPPEIQVKLLRVIQFGEFQMLGNPETRKVDVRIIAATNKDLSLAIAKGTFRNDLYYRLNVFPIHLPPLRDRKEDIPLLAWAFVDEIAGKMGKRIDKISTTGMNKLLRYNWPGNIRELRNVIEYSIILSHGPVLDIHLQESEPGTDDTENLNAGQKRHIEKVLDQTGWRIRGKGGAAEKLGMLESTLRFRMKKLGIERKL